jgi:hypothetical protein
LFLWVANLRSSFFQLLETHGVKRLLETFPLLSSFLPEQEEGADKQQKTEPGEEDMFEHRSEVHPRRLHNIFEPEQDVQGDLEDHTAE